MASQNIDQIFTANPITTNVSTDLMYFGQSPYGSGNDAAMTFANFSAQFASALAIQEQAFTYAVDSSGTPNSIVVAYDPPITSLPDGLSIWFQVANNTISGACNITVDSLSPVSLFRDGISGLGPNELIGGGVYNAIYTTNSGVFQVTNPDPFWVGSNLGFINEQQLATQQFVYGADSGTANHYVVNGTYYDQFSSPFSMGAGFYLSFLAANTNTTASDMTIGLGNVTSNIMKNSAAGLVALTVGNITAGNTYQMITSGSGPSAVWVLMNPN